MAIEKVSRNKDIAKEIKIVEFTRILKKKHVEKNTYSRTSGIELLFVRIGWVQSGQA